MAEEVKLYVDFNSAYSFIYMYSFPTIERDYRVKTCVVPFHTRHSYRKSSPRAKRLNEYKHMDAARYAHLLGIRLRPKGYEFDSKAAMITLLWLSKHFPDKTYEFAFKVFSRVWIDGVSYINEKEVNQLLLSVGVDQVFAKQYFKAYINSTGEEDLLAIRESSGLFGVPCVVLSNGEQYYSQYLLSLVRYKLHANGLKRRQGIIPDITCAYRFPEPKISLNIYGMPGTVHAQKVLSRNRDNSHNREMIQVSKCKIDVYIDIKSPHAYLAIDMSMALEEDFNVEICFQPFLLPIADIYGRASKGSGRQIHKKSERTEMQWKQVKWGYSTIRQLASLQDRKVLGTKKVFDSTLISIAMLWAKHCGRNYLDSFLEFTYPRVWQRMLDIEDINAVKSCLVQSEVPLTLPGSGSFDEYVKGDGKSQLSTVIARADQLGILGVPSYVLDGEVFFGKEHLSLIRLKLEQKGLLLDRNRLANPIDVPYLWRPQQRFPSTL